MVQQRGLHSPDSYRVSVSSARRPKLEQASSSGAVTQAPLGTRVPGRSRLRSAISPRGLPDTDADADKTAQIVALQSTFIYK